MATKKKTAKTAVEVTPEQLAARKKANERAKARRVKVKEIKELQDAAKEKLALGALNGDDALMNEGRELMAQATAKENELGTRAPLWETDPDGRLFRIVEFDGARIEAKIEPTADGGFVAGTAALSVGESSIMTCSGYVANGDKAIEMMKARMGVMISSLRTLFRKTCQ